MFVAGVHNDVQQPRKRLKFENVPTLLLLVRTRIASLTDYRSLEDTKSINAEGYVSQQSSTPEKLKEKFFPRVETSQRLPRLAVKWLDQLRHRTALLKMSLLCFTTNSVLVLAFLYFILCEVFVMCLYTFVYKLKIVTGLPWECFQISILYVVVASSLPFLLFLYHYALLFAAKQCFQLLRLHFSPVSKQHDHTACRYVPGADY